MSSMYRALKCRDGLYHACITTRSGGQISGYPLGPHRHGLGWTPASMLSHFCTFPGMRYAIRKNIIKIKIEGISHLHCQTFLHSRPLTGRWDVMSWSPTSALVFPVQHPYSTLRQRFSQFSEISTYVYNKERCVWGLSRISCLDKCEGTDRKETGSSEHSRVLSDPEKHRTRLPCCFTLWWWQIMSRCRGSFPEGRATCVGQASVRPKRFFSELHTILMKRWMMLGKTERSSKPSAATVPLNTQVFWKVFGLGQVSLLIPPFR
jgi:hypothetical protein